jgi:cytochrome c556
MTPYRKSYGWNIEMSNFGKFCAAAILAALVLIIAAPIAAPGAAQDMNQKMSQVTFKRTLLMGANYSRLGNLTNAAEAEDFVKAGIAAERLADNARALAGLWPKGSGGVATAAKRAIWTDMDGFKAALAEFLGAAKAAAAAAKAKDIGTLDAAAARTKRSCDICHKAYRTF